MRPAAPDLAKCLGVLWWLWALGIWLCGHQMLSLLTLGRKHPPLQILTQEVCSGVQGGEILNKLQADSDAGGPGSTGKRALPVLSPHQPVLRSSEKYSSLV